MGCHEKIIKHLCNHGHPSRVHLVFYEPAGCPRAELSPSGHGWPADSHPPLPPPYTPLCPHVVHRGPSSAIAEDTHFACPSSAPHL